MKIALDRMLFSPVTLVVLVPSWGGGAIGDVAVA